MRGQVCLAILVLRDLVLAASTVSCVSETEQVMGSWIEQAAGDRHARATTYPSYKPTASCTNKRVSSGSKDGRSAVVRSS